MNSIEIDEQFDELASYSDETVTYTEVSEASPDAATSSSLSAASDPWGGGRHRGGVLRYPGKHLAAQ